jgi:hypothetical protein
VAFEGEQPFGYEQVETVLPEQDSPPEEYFPPREFWLKNPYIEKAKTPVDQYGLIIVPDLIREVKDYVDEAYLWPRRIRIHHIYYDEAWYPNDHSPEAVVNPAAFRNLAAHKARLPLAFERLIHEATIPAAVPDLEVMSYRVDAMKVATDLFESVRRVINWERMARRRAAEVKRHPEVLENRPDPENYEQTVNRAIIEEVLDHHFRGALQQLGHAVRIPPDLAFFEIDQLRAALAQMERSERIPPELRVIDPSQPREALAAQLGKLVAPKKLMLGEEFPTHKFQGSRVNKAA